MIITCVMQVIITAGALALANIRMIASHVADTKSTVAAIEASNGN